jgi:choline dehydrogenase-like flavoprotein
MTTVENLSLSSTRRATLDALARIIVPHAFESASSQAGGGDLTALVEERIRGAPRAIAADLGLALDVLGSRAGAILVARSATALSKLNPDERGAAFDAWGRSALPPARAAHQAIRKLVLSTYYATAGAHRELGVLPPLHTRAPAFDWEGPAPGAVTLDTEPVARSPRRAAPVPGATPKPRPIPAVVTLGSGVRGEQRLSADIVVIGSGAGGAVAAARLAEAGRQVVILEEGSYLHAPDFTEEEEALAPRLFAEQMMRATVDGSISLFQGGAVGGGTTVNWMLMLRAPEHVLDEWRRRHGITGLGMDVLGPEFTRIEHEVHARLMPDDAHSPSNRVILDGARKLGWRATAAAINAKGCVRAGTCSLGCRYDAKQSALLTFLPRAFAAGARLFANARVERIEIAERSVMGPGSAPRKLVRAAVSDPGTGAPTGSIVVEAPVVILAAGAVGTPVILERSGLGGGGVGRYLRLHPTTAILGRYARDMYPLAGVPQSTMCDEFIRRDAHGYGFWIEIPAFTPGLAATALSGFGDAHRNDVRTLAQVCPLILLVRDGSDDRSAGAVWVDRRGNTRIRYRLQRADRENLVAGIEASARLLLAAGAEEVVTLHTPPVRMRGERDLPLVRAARYGANRISLFSAHVNGTCRMGTRPDISGTTPDGERHGVRGLYVCDGSLLPTSLGVNPQETIMALASVVAGRISLA